jgi:hypothetical protein
MTNIRFNNIEDYRDISTIKRYRPLKPPVATCRHFLKVKKELHVIMGEHLFNGIAMLMQALLQELPGYK